jgi:hypothetical protein
MVIGYFLIVVNFRFFFKIISHFFIGMTLPLALSASSYNEDDASGTTIQNSKALYMSRNNLEINKNTNNSSNNSSNDTKNKNNYRKTIKQKQNVPNQSKLSALLKSMDEASDSDNENENDNYKGNANTSSNYLGVSNGGIDNSNQNSHQNSDDTTYLKDIPTTNGNPISNKMYDSLSSNYANQYYNQFVSAVNKGYGSGLGSDDSLTGGAHASISMPKNELIEKLNYIIDLLEEQQDYKTNSILEDLILYAFLGIFIIFIVDSFSKSNKYVR